MDNIFLIKLIISFFIGALWVIVATLSADKFGPKIGGLISGLPSTVMFGLFFLGWTQTPLSSVQATTIIPIVGGINCLFLLSCVYFVRKNISFALIISLILWAVLSFVLVLIKFNNYATSLFGYTSLLLISFYVMENVLKIRSISGKKITYTPILILIRGLIGGFVIAFSVFIGKIGGPVLGGIFSMFPAMFISTILVTYYSQGALFSSATMKSSMLSGISIVLYSVIVRYSYLPLGLLWGTAISIFISFLCGYFVYRYVLLKLK